MKMSRIILFCLILAGSSASAQYGYGNGYGNGYGGTSHRMPVGNPNENKEPSAADIEKARNEKIEGFMKKLKEVLTLDELQFIAIKNDLTANGRTMEIVMKKENSEEEKQKELKALGEKSDKAILSYLNPAQKEKYLNFKMGKKDKSEDKKNRKEKEKTED